MVCKSIDEIEAARDAAAALARRQEVRNVVSSAEDAGLAENHRHGDGVVAVRAVERCGHCAVHVARQRIFLFRPVQPQDLDGAFAVDLDVFAHANAIRKRLQPD